MLICVNYMFICVCIFLVLGAELFFNMPRQDRDHPSSRYVYHTISLPAKYKIVPDATQTIQQITCDADFLGQLTLFLNSGWKLVDICLDFTVIAEGGTL